MTNRHGTTLLAGLLVAQVVLAVGGAALWTRSTFADSRLAAEMPTIGAEMPRPVTIESAFPHAAARARQWDSSARLILVSAQLDWPLDVTPGPVLELPGGGWLTFVFIREQDGEAESLGLLIERYSGMIVQERVVAWGGPAPVDQLALDDLPVDSAAAVVAAERAGGTEFRRSCPAARHQTRVSLGVAGAAVEATPADLVSEAIPTSGARAAWLVGYRDVRDEGRAPLRFSVDSGSGAVTIEDRRSPAVEGCPA